MKSRILQYIKNNPNDWEQKFNEMVIRTNRSGDLVCFKYGVEADMWNVYLSSADMYMIFYRLAGGKFVSGYIYFRHCINPRFRAKVIMLGTDFQAPWGVT